MDENLKIKIINRLYPIDNFFQKTSLKNNVKCEFHEDRKASARVYLHSNSMWCFTCGKFFYISNLLWKRRLNIDEIYKELEQMYSGENLEELYNKVCEEDKGIIVTKTYYKKSEKSIIEFTKEFFKPKDKLN